LRNPMSRHVHARHGNHLIIGDRHDAETPPHTRQSFGIAWRCSGNALRLPKRRCRITGRGTSRFASRRSRFGVRWHRHRFGLRRSRVRS
jgi:hypothetical protein